MLTYDIFYTMLIVPTWLLFTSAELLEEEGRQHMSIWLYGWCLLCLLPNGLFAAAAGECLNKLSSELWFARNKASIFLIDQHSDYPHLSSRYFSGFRLAYALQLHNNSDSTQYVCIPNQYQLSTNSAQVGIAVCVINLRYQWSIHKSCGEGYYFGCQNGLLMMSPLRRMYRHLQKP